MEIKVNFLDKLRLEAKFDDFTVVADQPIRYKGDGSAPGPFDYFLASSALCAAYFVKLYCETRNISTENIRLSQNNIVDPENRYQQIFKIQVELPPDIQEVDRRGILKSIERCTVKKVVQAGPEFVIEEVENLDADAQSLLTLKPSADTHTYIAGKDLPLEQTIANMSGLLANLGINASFNQNSIRQAKLASKINEITGNKNGRIRTNRFRHSYEVIPCAKKLEERSRTAVNNPAETKIIDRVSCN